MSSHSSVYLWFRSDASVAHRGFKLSWNLTDPVCGEVYSGQTHGTVRSPGYPGDYPHNRDCTWTVYAEWGKRIQFHFASMRLERHPNCSFDYVEVSVRRSCRHRFITHELEKTCAVDLGWFI